MACFPFKKKKQKNVSLVDQTLDDDQTMKNLAASLEVLTTQQEDLERQIKECDIAVKNCATTDRNMAVRFLRKKKRLEKTLQQNDCTLTTVELQQEALGNSQVIAAISGPMKAADEILKKANIKLNNNKVQTILDEVSEQHSVGQDISNSLMRYSLCLNKDEDEEEIAHELEKLQELMANETSAGTSELAKCPSVPKELVNVTFEDNENLKDQKLSMGSD